MRGPDECWIWTGKAHKRRYGYLGYQGRFVLAHRLSWELTNGPIPEGMDVCHTCDNPPCCNPAHLWIGTRADNNADKIAKGREVVLRGEMHGMAKLTWDQVSEIRSRYGAGEKGQVALAREYGVSKNLIHLIVTWKIWKHPR